MIRWFHIISVGTSSVNNYARACRDRPGSVDELLRFIREDPKHASAELNAFLRYVDKAGHSPPGDVGVHLIATDTDQCELAGTAIAEYLRSRGYSVTQDSPERVKYLGVGEEVFEEGLANLVDAYFAAVRSVAAANPGVRIYLNLTGGFKAEVSVLLLAAAVSGAAVAYYIHESFTDVVTVPLPALRIDKGLAQLVKEYVSYGRGWDCEVFRERATARGLDPERLLEDGLFMVHEECVPRKWLLSIIAEGV